MRNKLIAACIAVIAFGAFPAMANAIYLGETSGTALSAGTKIEATNEGNLKFTGAFGSVECTKSTLTGSLKTNAVGGAATEGEITSASFTGGGTTEAECASAFLGATTVDIEALPWCLRSTSKSSDKAELIGGACGKPANIKFTLTGTSGITCKYEAASITSNAYTTGSNTLKFESQPFSTTSGFPCTNGHFTGAYILETDGNSTAVNIYAN
jgi:hypothetical protein